MMQGTWKAWATTLLLAMVAFQLGTAPTAAEPVPRDPLEPTGAFQPSAARTLSDRDRAFLERLYTDCGIVDPRGAVRLRIVPADWTPAPFYSYDASGAWLLPGRDGQPGVIVAANGMPVPLPIPAGMVMSPVDFIGTCQAVFDDVAIWAQARTGTPEAREAKSLAAKAAQRLRLPPDSEIAAMEDYGMSMYSDLASAAWLMRLGREDLAAAIMYRYPTQSETQRAAVIEDIQRELPGASWRHAWSAFHAGRDSQAYAIATWTEQRYGAREPRPAHRPTLREELDRRRTLGRFDVVRDATLPEGFAAWPVAQRLDWLVDSLDDVTVFGYNYRSGAVDIDDPRALAILDLGDAAVPRLLETMATDARLARTVLFGEPWTGARDTVRDLAAVLLQHILQIRDVAPYLPEIDSQESGEPTVSLEALQLYWQRYGHLPLDQRLMAVLTDPAAAPIARRECAWALSMFDVPYEFDERHHFAWIAMRFPETTSRWIMARQYHQQNPEPAAPNPLTARYQNPTVAEAILAAMADEQRVLTAKLDMERLKLPKDNRVSPRDIFEGFDTYFKALACTRDPRIAPAVAAHAATLPSFELQVGCATTAARLGDFSGVTTLGDAWVRGDLALDPSEGDARTLEDLIGLLTLSGERRFAPAIAALATPAAPFSTRCRWARDAMILCDTSAVLQIAADTQAQRLVLETTDQAAELVDLLAVAQLPAADRALSVLMSPNGPTFPVLYGMLEDWQAYKRPWMLTPQGQALLDRALADTTTTGQVYVRDGDAYLLYKDGTTSKHRYSFPEGTDPALYEARAEQRVCDQVAHALSACIVGMPVFHVMQRDRDARISDMRVILARYGACLEPVDPQGPIDTLTLQAVQDPSVEADVDRCWLSTQKSFRFALTPLDHAATPADVEQGRALFHLGGQGARLDLALPAWAVILPADPLKTPDLLLTGQVVQAERTADGQVVYGVEMNDRMSRLPADRVRVLTPEESAAIVTSANAARKALREVQENASKRRWRMLRYNHL